MCSCNGTGRSRSFLTGKCFSVKEGRKGGPKTEDTYHNQRAILFSLFKNTKLRSFIRGPLLLLRNMCVIVVYLRARHVPHSSRFQIMYPTSPASCRCRRHRSIREIFCGTGSLETREEGADADLPPPRYASVDIQGTVDV